MSDQLIRDYLVRSNVEEGADESSFIIRRSALMYLESNYHSNEDCTAGLTLEQIAPVEGTTHIDTPMPINAE